jgi:molybdate transport system permease protein
VSRLFSVGVAVAAGITLLFLLLPIVAIFARVPPGDLLSALGRGQATDALVVSLETNLIALAAVVLAGTPTAWLIATRAGRLRDVAVTLVELPLVLPPAVAGIGLLAAFGRVGLVGGHVHVIGTSLAFTKAAVVVRVALPLAAGGLGAGAALAFARGIGEFGATLMFAGSLRGVTQTLPLAIYEAFDLDFDLALAISALLVAISAVVLLATKLAFRWRSTSPSTTLFAPSAPRST